MKEQKEYAGIGEMSKILGIHRSLFWRLIKNKRLPDTDTFLNGRRQFHVDTYKGFFKEYKKTRWEYQHLTNEEKMQYTLEKGK